MAGRAFTYNGRALVAYRNQDETAFRTALMQLDAMGQPDSPAAVPEGCTDLYLQLWDAATNLDATQFLMNESSQRIDATRVPTYVPGEGYAQLAAWLSDPELAAVVAYAPEGLVVTAEEARVLETILDGVSSIQAGRCSVRTKWGLVGAVAILGTIVVAGLAYTFKKPRRG